MIGENICPITKLKCTEDCGQSCAIKGTGRFVVLKVEEMIKELAEGQHPDDDAKANAFKVGVLKAVKRGIRTIK